MYEFGVQGSLRRCNGFGVALRLVSKPAVTGKGGRGAHATANEAHDNIFAMLEKLYLPFVFRFCISLRVAISVLAKAECIVHHG